MSNYRPDAGIPMLTEVIEPLSDDELAEEAAFLAQIDDVPQSAPAATMLDIDQLRKLEQEISERVLQQILARIDFVLEQRVRDNLADVLQTSVNRLAAELRHGLQQSLAEVVTRAVTQEISRLQSAKK